MKGDKYAFAKGFGLNLTGQIKTMGPDSFLKESLHLNINRIVERI